MLPVLTCCLLLSPALADPTPAEKKAIAELAGEWAIEQLQSADVNQTQDGIVGQIMVFTEKAWKFGAILEGEITSIDPSTTPKILDLKAKPKDGGEIIIEGIYKLNGDELWLAVHVGEDRNRPTGFDKPTETGTVVLKLKRSKG